MTPPVLTSDELRALTGKQRADAQRRELDYMGIPYHTRRDGSLVVLRGALQPGATIAPPEPELLP